MNGWSHTPTDLKNYLALAASLLLSAFVTFLSIRYSKKRQLIDQPGQRRSHSKPTVRGGGIGLVVASLIFFCGSVFSNYPKEAIATALALFAVALVGWIDDHRPLSAWIRISVHFSAALLWLLLPLSLQLSSGQIEFINPLTNIPLTQIVFFLAYGCGVLLVVWSINLHNFMDGINGLLACQAVFVFFVIGMVCGYSAYVKTQEMWWLWVLGAATLGFLPFNFPRAQIFMGDVGSGALGFLIALAVVLQMGAIGTARASGIIVCSAFVADATCTLLSRLFRGKRWYSAHREHLYQWMTRCGMSHSEVVAWYMAWNFIIVIPILYWINRTPFDSVNRVPQAGYGWAIAVYSVAVLLWLYGKNWCYSTMKSRYSHAST